MRTKNWAEWRAAMDKELAELNANARLVARGFTQRYGVDFESTFSPVLKISSIRFIVMLAAIWKVKLRQGDVPNAYLKSTLDKPIYLKPPPGTTSANDTRVWLLLKGLYGLKQSGKLWNDLIDAFLQAQGFQRSRMDPCLYFLRQHGKLCVLGLYVDDILIVSQNTKISDLVMTQLTERFNIKDLGDERKCLGVWIDYTASGIAVHQYQTTLDLLAKVGLDQCKASPTPMEVNHRFFEENGEPFQDTTLYREVIGSLLWLSNFTRPDIATATNCLSRFVSCPTSAHWSGVKRILRYLRGSADTGLFFKFGNGIASTLQPVIYSDANWAGDSSSAKSTSGSVLQINDMTISWSSRKQTTVALSTMEAEYVAACSAVQDCIAIRQLLQELGLMPHNTAILLRVDNQSAIKSMENAVTTQRTRHLQIKYHFIRDAIANKQVQVEYCPTQQQLADIFTKATDPQLQHRRDAPDGGKEVDGAVEVEGRLWIPTKANSLVKRIFVIAHCGAQGDRGVHVMIELLNRHFSLDNVRPAVVRFINECLLCKQVKGGTLIQRDWTVDGEVSDRNECMHMDYLYLGESYREAKYVLVLKDELTHYCELVAADSADSQTAMQAILDWHKRFGLPAMGMSDNGAHFKNYVMEWFAERLGVPRGFVPVYSPWINGTVERVKRDILEVLRVMLLENQLDTRNWVYLLPLVQANLNRTPVISLGNCASVELFTGLPAPSALDFVNVPED
ncbi:unnamed protein product [Phytophthora fragariaefolia]|uniref:Unnamed protein product n=1 Tax=Phytophthora fragariaefolia TaxID=1490495 RepID=A0A9W6U3B4_9STRA|nr:unnamed protein product [Phytophthora fragariaefolia]